MTSQMPAFPSVEAEHPDLVPAVAELLTLLDDSADHFGLHLVDYTTSDRLADLSSYLRSALLLANAGQHGAAFALLRAALEQTFVDELLLCATKTALPLRNGDGEVIGQISPYWPVLEEHDPTVGPPHRQKDLALPLSNESDRREYAERNRDIYTRWLRWDSIRRNLELNGLRDKSTCDRLDVHYRFLGGWTHASESALKRTRHAGRRLPCHYCSELTLLYAARLAAIEVENVLTHAAERDRPLPKSRADEFLALIGRARQTSDHLWFPDGQPQDFDRWFAVTCLIDREGIDDGRDWPAMTPPDEEIPYHPDPLHRLVEVHRSGTELITNLTYVSPWQRADSFHF